MTGAKFTPQGEIERERQKGNVSKDMQRQDVITQMNMDLQRQTDTRRHTKLSIICYIPEEKNREKKKVEMLKVKYN